MREDERRIRTAYIKAFGLLSFQAAAQLQLKLKLDSFVSTSASKDTITGVLTETCNRLQLVHSTMHMHTRWFDASFDKTL